MAPSLQGKILIDVAVPLVPPKLTSVLIALNRRYKVPDSGIRITGIPTG